MAIISLTSAPDFAKMFASAASPVRTPASGTAPLFTTDVTLSLTLDDRSVTKPFSAFASALMKVLNSDIKDLSVVSSRPRLNWPPLLMSFSSLLTNSALSADVSRSSNSPRSLAL